MDEIKQKASKQDITETLETLSRKLSDLTMEVYLLKSELLQVKQTNADLQHHVEMYNKHIKGLHMS